MKILLGDVWNITGEQLCKYSAPNYVLGDLSRRFRKHGDLETAESGIAVAIARWQGQVQRAIELCSETAGHRRVEDRLSNARVLYATQQLAANRIEYSL